MVGCWNFGDFCGKSRSEGILFGGFFRGVFVFFSLLWFWREVFLGAMRYFERVRTGFVGRKCGFSVRFEGIPVGRWGVC